tara:strand:+ start:703 stop:3969 length:3267 start_codon:yes stop_codon:yes gene_type:complete
MSKKRASRNTKKVLKSLQQKRKGRVKAYTGWYPGKKIISKIKGDSDTKGGAGPDTVAPDQVERDLKGSSMGESAEAGVWKKMYQALNPLDDKTPVRDRLKARRDAAERTTSEDVEANYTPVVENATEPGNNEITSNQGNDIVRQNVGNVQSVTGNFTGPSSGGSSNSSFSAGEQSRSNLAEPEVDVWDGISRPERRMFPAGKAGMEAYKEALAAWKKGKDIGGDDGDDDSGGDVAELTDKEERLKATAERTENIATGSTPDDMIKDADVETLDVGSITEDSTNAEKLKAGISTDVKSVADREDTTFTKVDDPDVITAESGTAETADDATQVTAKTYDAVTAGAVDPTEAAEGEVSKEVEAGQATLTEAEAAERDAAQEEAAKASKTDFQISDEPGKSAYVPEVTFRDGVNVAPTKEAEAKTREAITGTPAEDGQAAQIIDTVGYEAAKRRTVTGEAARGGAASMIAEVGELPPEITAAVVEDPATVEAQIDEQPVEVRAAIAALPTEALVSSQMETLLAGMDDGNTPAWARPAVAAIEQQMAQRGLSASSVGRDALFNAIIQSALPIAQSNAQALQSRAAQNLSNQQQANLAQSTQDMQRRMANLSNRQTAASQTAQYAQQMATLQSQFTQQAILTTAEQQQQTRTQNLANRQQAAVLNAQQQQATNAQNLGNEQQLELAELQFANETERENMTAENQRRLAEMNVAADFLSKNAGFKQQMELANLSNDQQMRLANLTAQNQASADNLNAAQQTELANLNTRMQTNLLQAQIAERMGVAQLNVDQQRAIQNAAMVANVDLTKFNADQQVELANSKFMQNMTMKDLDNRQQTVIQNATLQAQMDMANADNRTKASIANAQNFLSMDIANLNNEQQAIMLDQRMEQDRLLSDQAAKNAALQFNAKSETQVDQFNAGLASEIDRFNSSQKNLMEQFNVSEANKAEAINVENQIKVDSINSELGAKVNMFDQELQYRADAWNAANAQAVEQSNIEWRRKANTIDTAAQNAANQQGAGFAFNLTNNAQNALWQEMRDQAAFDQQSSQSAKDRALNLLNAALGNDTFLKAKSDSSLGQARTKIFNMISKILAEV